MVMLVKNKYVVYKLYKFYYWYEYTNFIKKSYKRYIIKDNLTAEEAMNFAEVMNKLNGIK